MSATKDYILDLQIEDFYEREGYFFPSNNKKTWTPYFKISPNKDYLIFEVAGVNYTGENGNPRIDNLYDLIHNEEQGESIENETYIKKFPVIFKKEPDNEYDFFAVKIYVKNPKETLIDAGYVPRNPKPKNYYQFNQWLMKNIENFEPPQLYYDPDIHLFLIECKLKKEKFSQKDRIFEPFIQSNETTIKATKQKAKEKESKTGKNSTSQSQTTSNSSLLEDILGGLFFWFLIGVLIATWQIWVTLLVFYLIYLFLTDSD